MANLCSKPPVMATSFRRLESYLLFSMLKQASNEVDVLKSLPRPEYKDMLNRRNSELEKDAMISRRKQQVPDVIIILDSKKQKYCSFANLKLWMQSFKLDEYDPAEIERLTITLKRDSKCHSLPNIQKGNNDTCVAFSSTIHSHPTKFDHCTRLQSHHAFAK